MGFREGEVQGRAWLNRQGPAYLDLPCGVLELRHGTVELRSSEEAHGGAGQVDAGEALASVPQKGACGGVDVWVGMDE